MNFFISDALAQGGQTAAQQANPLMTFLPLIVIFVVFYFLLIRPQSRRAKEHKKMVENLAKGDEVVTNGGVLGRIIDVGDNFVAVEVAENVRIKVQRQSVATVMPKGTIKTD